MGLAGGVGLLHRERPLSLADRRQCGVQCSGLSAEGRANLVRHDAHIRRGLARGAGLGLRRAVSARHLGGLRSRSPQGTRPRHGPDRHGRTRGSARSGRLAAAQCLHALAGAAAAGRARQPRRHDGDAAHGEKRGGTAAPRARGQARRHHARDLPRYRAARREGVRKSTAA